MFWDRRIASFLLFGTAILLIVVLVVRARAASRYGEALAICPGPDLYGYSCTTELTADYINATNDTFLYEDDGVIEIPLPFPFTFYGNSYNSVQASSNGVLTFGGEGNPTFENGCPTAVDGLVPDMGDIIAPYWTDMDLRSEGYLEYEVVGTAPERIFVIEWDAVPLYATAETVTFEVQLHEATDDVLILYDNVDSTHGRNATIALQSAQLGVALTYSCNQAAVADGLQLGFIHPEEANPDLYTAVPPITVSAPTADPALAMLKGDAATIAAQLAQGEQGLQRLAQVWQQQIPPRTLRWATADITGHGRADLLTIWQTPAGYTQAALFQQEADQTMTLLWSQPLSTRPNPIVAWQFEMLADRTGNGRADLVLRDPNHGLALFSWDGTSFQRMR